MSKSTTVQPQKRRGPKPTGKGTPIQVRLQPELLSPVDDIAAGQELSRPDAIRMLVRQALTERGYLKD